MHRFLFVCTANVMRSPTAAHVAMLRGLIARSCGIDEKFCVTPLTRDLLDWAHTVVCMRARHADAVKRLGGAKRIVVWDCRDLYKGQYCHPEFLPICEEKITQMLEQLKREGVAV